MVCPLAKLQVNVQLLIVVLPVLVMVRLAPKPPCHWLVMAYCTEHASPPVTGVGVVPCVGVGVGVALLPASTSMPSTLALSVTLVNWSAICPLASAVAVYCSTIAL